MQLSKRAGLNLLGPPWCFQKCIPKALLAEADIGFTSDTSHFVVIRANF